ncbi:LysM peptidoglycan-binding domain-containing protein [Butyrivibrio proteoclasticus]|uniref:LysM peptidoglycan-binding domain-containing protein n=1 Tax=Butyrivibrio proteoclasticus TaxID=43305 RepID=UPI00047C800F|nr:LysM peptidoglycan-binding domain-containing protein [Butyrivibrio proteoclasticus]
MNGKVLNGQFMSSSELRIYNNKLRRIRIVRRQRICLAFIIFIVVFISVFLISSLKLKAQSEDFTPKCKYYKVISVEYGDTLWDIASSNIDYDYYNSLESYLSEIETINKLDESGLIKAGENLVIPYYDVLDTGSAK